jgi:exopolyphosphatase/guanosine-5'-triphosphate,3'-diphosphate pyrophosphatase
MPECRKAHRMDLGVSGMVPGNDRGRRDGRADGAPTFAAIDLGTNNCRLLVARAHRSGNGDGFTVVDSFSRIVRLGEGLASSGRLSEAAIARTVEALGVCAGKIERWGVAQQRHIATEACRRAANCHNFVAEVAQRTGLKLEIIPPIEEARLALAGCVPLLDPAYRRVLLIDIGGGSTEASWIERYPGANGAAGQPHLIDSVSLPFGVVSLSEAFAGHWRGGRLDRQRYSAVMHDVAAKLQPFDQRHGIAAAIAQDQVQMIGTSGTVTTVAGINLGLRRYQRNVVDGTRISRMAVQAVCRELLEHDLAGLASHGCIGVERADLVLAGCAILEGICALWPASMITVADRGLREGVLMDLIRGEQRLSA